MKENLYEDHRIVMTLDAGGTNFVFSAIKSGYEVVTPITLASFANDLYKCLQTLIDGFELVKDALYPEVPDAISFAFPGPADYKNGVVGDLPNFPAFRGGVAIGPMLENHFQIPTLIHNDGDLFAYGEAVAGFLPYINTILNEKKANRSYQNLIGLTLGTGFGAGIVLNGVLCTGDNSVAGEIWLSRNHMYPNVFAEESVSIRGIQRVYANESGDDTDWSPKQIYQIAKGKAIGNKLAAIKAFEEMGKVIGESLANTLTILDAAVVIGGGISGASEFIIPAIIRHLEGSIEDLRGNEMKRIVPKAIFIENEETLYEFVKSDTKFIQIPFSENKTAYNEVKKLPIGVSTLGTSKAIWLGSYALAIEYLNQKAIHD